MKANPWARALLAGLSSCADPLEAPPALEGETFLCDEAHAADFEAKLDECRSARARESSACAGLLSFQGNIDGDEVVVDTFASRVTYNQHHFSGGADLSIAVFAEAPYYTVRFDMTAGLTTDQSQLPSGLTESTYLNFEARGGNYLSNIENGVFDIRYQTLEEARTWAAGDLARGGYVEVCYHVFLPPI